MTEQATKPPSVAALKAEIRRRDGFRCVECGLTEEEHVGIYRRTLDVHRLVPGSLYTLEGCVTLCKACHSSKPKRKRGQPDLANTDGKATVKIWSDVLRDAKMVAASLGVDLYDYFDLILRPRVKSDFGKMLSEESARRRE